MRSPFLTWLHDARRVPSSPSARFALSASVASITTLPSLYLCSVPFKPLVFELPLALEDKEAGVLKGSGFLIGVAGGERAIGTTGAVATNGSGFCKPPIAMR